MDDRVTAVLDRYHERMRAERAMPRDAAHGGRDGGQDQRMRAVGPQTGQFLNILVRSLKGTHPASTTGQGLRVTGVPRGASMVRQAA